METWQRDKGLQEDYEEQISQTLMGMKEAMETLSWVREHGGLENVKAMFDIGNNVDIKTIKKAINILELFASEHSMNGYGIYLGAEVCNRIAWYLRKAIKEYE